MLHINVFPVKVNKKQWRNQYFDYY